jgi:hypothetical protein
MIRRLLKSARARARAVIAEIAGLDQHWIEGVFGRERPRGPHRIVVRVSVNERSAENVIEVGGDIGACDLLNPQQIADELAAVVEESLEYDDGGSLQ